MTTNGLLRGLWIVSAGAFIALGAGHGVAAAESDSTDGGAGSSSAPSPQSSQPATGAASAGAKNVEKGQDSVKDPKGVDKPTTTVSASTVTVDRDEAATAERVAHVKSPPSKYSKRAGKATPITDPTVQAEAAEPVAKRSVDVTPPKSAVVDVASASVATVTKTAAPQPSGTKDVATPAVVTTVAADATAKPGPAAEVTPGIAAVRSLAAPVAHAPRAGPLATVVISLLSAFGVLPHTPAVPAAVVGTEAQPVPDTSSIGGVTGVKVGSSDVQIPVGSATYTGAADWYFPTQGDGTVQAQGVVWLQHGFLGSKSWYSALAQQLARQTNSVVVVPNVPSFPFFTCSGCTLSSVSMQQGVAALFEDPNRASLNASANAAGFQGTLPEKFVLSGHSAGGGLAAAAGGFYTDAVAPADNDLLGVVMFDGVTSTATLNSALNSLGDIPVYQIAAPPQPWNADGQTTQDLVALRPDQFVGDTLVNGSHVDSLIGGVPIIDFISQLVIRRSPPGNTAAVYTLATGWINDFYADGGPTDPRYGFYGTGGQPLIMGKAAAVVLGTSQGSPVSAPALTNGVTGVKVGHSDLDIPVGSATYTGAADWYLPTQADGTVQAQGVTYLQHGFLGDKSWYSALARQLAQQTNSVVVVPNVPSFQFLTCSGCTLNSVSMQEGVAALFADPSRASLTISANAAGYQGALPENFVLTGHSAGGGLAAAAGGFYTDEVAPADNDLLGVVMFDGVASSSTGFADALNSLGNIPVYQIAAPPQAWNANGQTTQDLVALRPDQFVGDTLANGSHVDSLIGGVPVIDFISQLLIRRSPPGNTAAVYTLADGWINDFYAGAGPTDPQYGIYGEPDQFIVMGPTAAVVLGPAPVIDLDQYLGTWYEVGSVKQFFSIGLVNTTAVYSPNLDGSIRVVNSGNYFVNNGPQSTIVGSAVPVDPDNNKLNVSFFGPASATPPGNYWIVDVAPDYSWAIVSDARGSTGFLLSRTRTVPDALYQELLDRASVKGVNRWITRTRQPAAVAV